MKIHKAYKYRLYPTPEQNIALKQAAGNTRFLWNKLLAKNIEKYNKEKKFIFWHDMCNSLPDVKKEYDFLKLTYAQSLQQVCRHLDKALKDAFNKNSVKQFPVFKKKVHGSDSFTVPQYFRISKNYVFIPKIGEVKWIKHRPINGKVKHITIKQDGEQWYCSVTVVLKIKTPPPQTEKDLDNFGGNDMGIKTQCTLSDGSKIENPKILKKYEKKLKREQRKFSRRTKGGKNREKQRKVVSKIHKKIKNTRKDAHHKHSHSIITTFSGMTVESLFIQGMMKNHKLAKAVADCAWGELFRQLEYKSYWAGKFFHKCDRFDATSKTCCRCGWKNKDLKLKDRVFICQECGLVIDRDLNASINLCKIGIIAFLKLEIPWDSRESFDLYVSKVRRKPEEIGGFSTSVQCLSLNQEKELVGFGGLSVH